MMNKPGWIIVTVILLGIVLFSSSYYDTQITELNSKKADLLKRMDILAYEEFIAEEKMNEKEDIQEVLLQQKIKDKQSDIDELKKLTDEFFNKTNKLVNGHRKIQSLTAEFEGTYDTLVKIQGLFNKEFSIFEKNAIDFNNFVSTNEQFLIELGFDTSASKTILLSTVEEHREVKEMMERATIII